MVSWRWCWSVLLLYLSLVQAAIVIVVIVSCDGAVYKCSERDFTEEHRDGQLMPDGTIKWKEEKLKQLLDIVTYDTPCVETINSSHSVGVHADRNKWKVSTATSITIAKTRIMEMNIADYIKYQFNNAYINPANYQERI